LNIEHAIPSANVESTLFRGSVPLKFFAPARGTLP
jgi:hypothetical protein